MFHEYPYTDNHEMNLDWIIKRVQKLDYIVENKLEQMIREQLDKLFINAVYDAATETLMLTLDMH